MSTTAAEIDVGADEVDLEDRLVEGQRLLGEGPPRGGKRVVVVLEHAILGRDPAVAEVEGLLVPVSVDEVVGDPVVGVGRQAPGGAHRQRGRLHAARRRRRCPKRTAARRDCRKRVLVKDHAVFPRPIRFRTAWPGSADATRRPPRLRLQLSRPHAHHQRRRRRFLAHARGAGARAIRGAARRGAPR